MAYSANACCVNAPAKINLHLRVKEKRSDGFHELESVFAALDFGDTLYFERTGEEGNWDFRVNWHPTALESLSDEPVTEDFSKNNLVSRAVVLFRAKTGIKFGLRGILEKRIPLGAGLGGGSSDAAASLLALNALAETGFAREDLREMALSLGSDVPFFLFGGAAWVSGQGERIKPLPDPKNLGVLLVKPPFRSNTAEAYRLLDKGREEILSQSALEFGSRNAGLGAAASEKFIKAWSLAPRDWPFFNDFQSVLPEAKAYRKILQDLKAQGADFSGLSGSGSCCFGVFENREKAVLAEKVLKSRGANKNCIYLTFFLASGANPVLQ